jgi:hypothetical protein
MNHSLAGLTLLSFLAAGLMAAPAAAVTYSMRFYNGVQGTVTSLKVRDAHNNPVPVLGFVKIPSGTSQRITITLPGNDCQAFVDTKFDGGQLDTGRVPFCIMQTGVAIVPRPDGRSLWYVPWRQLRASGGHPN